MTEPKSLNGLLQRMAEQLPPEGRARLATMPENERRAWGDPYASTIGEGDPACPQCAGAGFYKYNVAPTDPRFGRMITCDCHPAVKARRAADLAARQADCGVPAAMQDWHIDYLRQWTNKTAALDMVELLWRQQHGWLTLWGVPGVGKTSAAIALVNRGVAAGLRCKIVVVAKILEDLRDTFAKEATVRETEVMARYTGYDLLVADELDPDRFNATTWALAALFRVFNARYELRHEKMTLFTSNRDPRKLGADWVYLVDRMRDGAVVEMPGPSLRGLKVAR